jgi:hypothetical protein
MKIHHFLFALILLSSSCMWGTPNKPKPDITTDTLTYTYQTVKQRAADCGNKPDSGCTIAKIKYPVFADQKNLNDSVVNKIVNLFKIDDVNTATWDLKIYSQSFIDGYEKNKTKYHAIEHYSLNTRANILRQDSSLTTLEIDGKAIQDGFRENAMTTYINWNTKANKNVELADVLINGYLAELSKIAENIFRKQEKLSDTASLKKDYFFKDGKFALNQNYSITPLGIKFLYNVYEIKPYAAGTTDLFIPYAQIKSLLKPNTVITQYLK